MDVTPAEVDREMQSHGVSQLIHGHTHRPARHEARQAALGAGRLGAEGWAMQASRDDINLYNFIIINS